MYIRNIRGPSTEPCSTPMSIFSYVDSYPLKFTYCSLSAKYDLIHSYIFPFLP